MVLTPGGVAWSLGVVKTVADGVEASVSRLAGAHGCFRSLPSGMLSAEIALLTWTAN